jgi:hypothetical protein
MTRAAVHTFVVAAALAGATAATTLPALAQTPAARHPPQAAASAPPRDAFGDFKTLDDLRNVPGLAADRIETQKARIIF